jgi:Putative bacterial sensory transduction regulator
MSGRPVEVAGVVREALDGLGLHYTETSRGVFSFELPGERKLATPCRLTVGHHSVAVHAFVCRNPDENHVDVYRWLLARGMKLVGIGFAVDSSGDIFLVGGITLAHVDAIAVDQLLGEVLATADGAFNTILELGFASSIRREWQWRLDRGESTANLAAFRGWLEPSAGTDGGDRSVRVSDPGS